MLKGLACAKSQPAKTVCVQNTCSAFRTQPPFRAGPPIPQGCVPLAALPAGCEVSAANGLIWNAEDVALEDFGTRLAQVERLSPLAHPRLLGALQLYQR